MPSTNDIWGSKKLVIATYLKFAISEILMCAEHLRFMLMSENTLLSSLWWLQNLSAVYRAPPPTPFLELSMFCFGIERPLLDSHVIADLK